MSLPETYNLCLSFTRSGHQNRVPWLFVTYKEGSPTGIRLRVKAIEEVTQNPTSACPSGYAFLARENAYGTSSPSVCKPILRIFHLVPYLYFTRHIIIMHLLSNPVVLNKYCTTREEREFLTSKKPE